MANKVTFDYSKAAPFVQEHEVELMKKLALDATGLDIYANFNNI